jgi:hypothetical protein
VVARLVVDDQDAAVAVMVAAAGGRRGQGRADRDDHREHQHCCTSLHGPKPPG